LDSRFSFSYTSGQKEPQKLIARNPERRPHLSRELISKITTSTFYTSIKSFIYSQFQLAREISFSRPPTWALTSLPRMCELFDDGCWDPDLDYGLTHDWFDGASYDPGISDDPATAPSIIPHGRNAALPRSMARKPHSPAIHGPMGLVEAKLPPSSDSRRGSEN
jgi:hypothetical protein